LGCFLSLLGYPLSRQFAKLPAFRGVLKS